MLLGFGGQKECPRGTYCHKGEKMDCKGGTYGDQKGGFRPSCSGPCAGGYYCPPGNEIKSFYYSYNCCCFI